MPPTPIQSPSGYSVSQAVAYADVDGSARLVSTTSPLPVMMGNPATTPVAGTAAATGVIGPFLAVRGRPVVLVLGGTWTGTVRTLRSTDGGTTRSPLTVAGTAWGQFTGNCCEPIWEESEDAAQLYLDITLTSGSVTYRLGQ